MAAVDAPSAVPFATHEVANQAPPLEGRNLFTDNVALVEALERWAAMDVARRAAEPIRVDVNRTFADWLSSFRAARREALHGPVAAEDSLRLLSYAAPRTLPAKLQDVDVIRRADDQAAAYRDLLRRRASLAFELARSVARADVARAGREELIGTARTAGAKEDLVATEALLVDKLEAVADVDAAFDFHRFKGTLARPLPGAPDFAFGVTAPLTRGTGLTWRGEADEVRAAGAGTVVIVETLEGWGRLVAVDHGGGYRSVYAHLDRVDVAVGRARRFQHHALGHQAHRHGDLRVQRAVAVKEGNALADRGVGGGHRGTGTERTGAGQFGT